jgi:hypothetical protein
MSFPDFIDNTTPPTSSPNFDFTSSDPFQQQQPQPQSSSFDPSSLSSPVQQQIPSSSSLPFEQDDEEQARLAQRQTEEAERRKLITAKMELELKIKNENREKASAYMREYESKRAEEVAKRKQLNVQNEKSFLEEKKIIKEGKKNAWECVVDNISIKDSEYKGSKDVSRMKGVILNRKNDKQLTLNNDNAGNSEMLFN